MEDFKELYRKAGVLMQGALNKYAEGNIEGGDKERQQANDMYDEANRYVDMKATNISALYGENRNFGIIYNVFENNAENLYKTKNGRKAIKEIVKLIKENKILREQHSIYKAFESIDENIENQIGISKYIDSVIEAIEPIKQKTIIENNEKLINLYKKYGLNEMVQIDDEAFNLYEAIEHIILNKPTVNNIKGNIMSKALIESHLKKNINRVKKNEDNSFEEMVNELKSKYTYSLNDDEKEVIDILSENLDTETIFNNYRDNIIKNINIIISENSDSNIKKQFNETISSIKNMVYAKDTVVDDIIKLLKIKNKLSE